MAFSRIAEMRSFVVAPAGWVTFLFMVCVGLIGGYRAIIIAMKLGNKSVHCCLGYFFLKPNNHCGSIVVVYRSG